MISFEYKQGYIKGVLQYRLNKSEAADICGISRNNFYRWGFGKDFKAWDLVKHFERTNRPAYKYRLLDSLGIRGLYEEVES